MMIDWFSGARGPPGFNGVAGSTGATGRPGNTGPSGFPGATGFTGFTGNTGFSGGQGNTGSPGTPGIQGQSSVCFTARRYASRVLTRYMPSSCVCLSVCLSSTLRYCIKTAKLKIMQIVPHDRSGAVVL